ncbi:hypothetical protein TYRP_020542, partial [Tyrophagus putrescentiae]
MDNNKSNDENNNNLQDHNNNNNQRPLRSSFRRRVEEIQRVEERRQRPGRLFAARPVRAQEEEEEEEERAEGASAHLSPPASPLHHPSPAPAASPPSSEGFSTPPSRRPLKPLSNAPLHMRILALSASRYALGPQKNLWWGRFQPKANLTAYELYWCELVEQSHVPVLTHPSNVLSVQPSVSFALSARGLTPITATCMLDNFKPSRVSEYRVVFYNGDANSAADSRQYHLGTYHVRLNGEEEFFPDSTQPEVTVHGRRFTFPVFEVTIDRRFSNNIVYYCALELGAPGTTGGLKYNNDENNNNPHNHNNNNNQRPLRASFRRRIEEIQRVEERRQRPGRLFAARPVRAQEEEEEEKERAEGASAHHSPSMPTSNGFNTPPCRPPKPLPNAPGGPSHRAAAPSPPSPLAPSPPRQTPSPPRPTPSPRLQTPSPTRRAPLQQLPSDLTTTEEHIQIVTNPLQRILVGELAGITDDVLLNAIGDLPEGFPIRVTDEERARWAREFRLQQSLMTQPNWCRQNGWCTHVSAEGNGIANIRRHNNLARGTGPHCLEKTMTARCIFCPYKCAHKKNLVEHYIPTSPPPFTGTSRITNFFRRFHHASSPATQAIAKCPRGPSHRAAAPSPPSALAPPSPPLSPAAASPSPLQPMPSPPRQTPSPPRPTPSPRRQTPSPPRRAPLQQLPSDLTPTAEHRDLPEGFPIRVTDEERARWAREFRLQRSLMTEVNRCRQNGWCTHVAAENNGIANSRRHNNLARGTGPHCLGKEMTARCIFCPYKCAHKKSL